MSILPNTTRAQTATVIAVSASPMHAFSKPPTASITLLEGLGVEGDAHAGVTVKHRSRVKVDPTQPNLRQVHLIHGELLDELNAGGFDVSPGVLGENVTTRGIDLLGLPRGARLHIGPSAIVEVTGLRNPCAQLDAYQKGLTAATLGRDPDGEVVRKAGVMATVAAGGTIAPGDAVRIELPAEPHHRLEKV